jgi:hypothetical protein
MESVKTLLGDLWMKMKLAIALVVAGLAVGAVAWRNHVTNGLAEVDQKAKEELAKQEAAKKLAEETAKLEAEAAAKKAEIEAEEAKKKAELEVTSKAKAEKLKKADSKEVKKEAAKVLGLKEGKKGRPKKND